MIKKQEINIKKIDVKKLINNIHRTNANHVLYTRIIYQIL